MNLSHVLSPLRDVGHQQPNNRLFHPNNIQIKSHHEGLSGVSLQQMLSQRLTSSIGDKLGVRPVDKPSEAQPGDFSAKTVADNVMGFVQNHMDRLKLNGASTEELEVALAEARKGVELGISQATEVINGLNMMTDELETGIADVGTLLTERLDKLADQIRPPEGVTSDIKTRYHNVTKAESSSSFDLQITTQEGDKVTIQINRSSQMMEVSNVKSSEEGTSATHMSKSKSHSSFSFEVLGDLNETETAAIEELLGKVNTLADEFFNGDLMTAFEQAGELGFDDETIANFALNIQQEQRIEVKESVYARVSGSGSLADLSSPLDKIASFARDFVDAIQPAETTPDQQDQSAVASSLLTEFVHQDQRFADMITDMQEQANQMLDRLTGSITGSIAAQI
ncbi:MAG: DUF5610 domain-containing protein [Pseudomonadales bacterium]|nr:DUF5610 domain-containing protein [Pseudomonadales bacterium]